MDSVPKSLADMIVMLRTTLDNARIGGSRAMESDTSFCLANISYWTESTPAITAACEHAATACSALASYIDNRGALYSASAPDAQRLRNEASHAIDALETVLQNALPSGPARNLHLPW